MADNDSLIRELEARFAADGVAFLLVQFVDIHGAAKVKLVPASALETVAREGAGFAGGAVWGMGQGPDAHDLMARVDLATYTPMPLQPGVARFAADLFVDQEPHPYCPRQNLKRVLDQARHRGYTFNVGIEPEFFLVTRNPDGSIRGYDPRAIDHAAKPCYDYKAMAPVLEMLGDLARGLNNLGWGVYQADHEDANDQYEINYQYSDALTSADRLIFFRMMLGEAAHRAGAIATFMPKPFADRTGSGAHLHYHLARADDGVNLFEDAADPRGLGQSALAYHFLGGVVEHARALCAVLSPTVNCYKRLRIGAALRGSRSGYTWTPAFIALGDSNRTLMLRAPGPGHVEDRSVSSAVNPYLSLAAYLAAGLDGIERGLDPGPPIRGNLYDADIASMAGQGVKTLPQTLIEALGCLERDPVVREALGPITEEFLKLKHDEWNEYHAQVEAWEIHRYLTAL